MTDLRLLHDRANLVLVINLEALAAKRLGHLVVVGELERAASLVIENVHLASKHKNVTISN